MLDVGWMFPSVHGLDARFLKSWKLSIKRIENQNGRGLLAVGFISSVFLSGCDCRGQMLCDGSADAFGCARSDGDFADSVLLLGFVVFQVWLFASGSPALSRLAAEADEVIQLQNVGPGLDVFARPAQFRDVLGEELHRLGVT